MIYPRHQTRVRLAIVALLVLTGAGCTLLSPVKIETKRLVLNQMPLTIPQQTTHPATLLVLPPETNPILDTTRIAYMIRPYDVAYFTQNEWSATPAQMLMPLLIKTLEGTHYFSDVFIPPYPSSYTYALRTEIADLTQDYTNESAAVQLSLRFQLIDGATNRIIATREITQREPMQQKTPYSGVVAANNATAKALQEAAGFVLANIK